jgi:hypothetical protein
MKFLLRKLKKRMLKQISTIKKGEHHLFPFKKILIFY